MIIQISTGEVHLKDSLTRRAKYDMNNRESEAVMLDPLNNVSNIDTKKANEMKEYKVLLVIEKIIINGEEKPITMNTLLNEKMMNDEDFEKVFNTSLEHANTLSAKAEPSKKS